MRATLRSITSLAAIAIAIPSMPATLVAQTATQTVTFSVVAASKASFGGIAWQGKKATAVAQRTPTSASIGSSSYSIETNEINQKILASIDSAPPAGVSVAVALGAPKGARSAGNTVLGTKAVDVVTGISKLTSEPLPIDYNIGSTPAARGTAKGRAVTFTITGGA